MHDFDDLSVETENTINMIQRLMTPHVGELEISPPFAYLDYTSEGTFLTFSIDQDGEFGYELEYNEAKSNATPAAVTAVNALFSTLST